MDEHYHVERQADLAQTAIEDLRVAVGWDRCPNRYHRIIAGSYTHFSIAEGSRLIGFLNVISDGCEDALLLDLMIHPDFQRHGLGLALVSRAIQDLKADGIRCIQVTFRAGLEPFYRRLGFRITSGGIVECEDRSG